MKYLNMLYIYNNMAYFNSLSSYKETQKAVAQHTTDMEESVKDAKAEASQKAYEGYSQLLDSAGGVYNWFSRRVSFNTKNIQKI